MSLVLFLFNAMESGEILSSYYLKKNIYIYIYVCICIYTLYIVIYTCSSRVVAHVYRTYVILRESACSRIYRRAKWIVCIDLLPLEKRGNARARLRKAMSLEARCDEEDREKCLSSSRCCRHHRSDIVEKRRERKLNASLPFVRLALDVCGRESSLSNVKSFATIRLALTRKESPSDRTYVLPLENFGT